MAKNPLRIADASLREGQQCVLATRMRTEDMAAIAGEIDRVGFDCAEVWGGATFDVALRFLNEDPWERVRTLKKLMPNTPFTLKAMRMMQILTVLKHLQEKGEVALKSKDGKLIWSLSA